MVKYVRSLTNIKRYFEKKSLQAFISSSGNELNVLHSFKRLSKRLIFLLLQEILLNSIRNEWWFWAIRLYRNIPEISETIEALQILIKSFRFSKPKNSDYLQQLWFSKKSPRRLKMRSHSMIRRNILRIHIPNQMFNFFEKLPSHEIKFLKLFTNKNYR